MKEEKTADNDNIAELMLIVAKELEEIANREEIKCKFSYLEGMKRGFELKQQEEKKKQSIQKVIKEIDEVLDKYKKRIVITFTDGTSKTLYHIEENKKVQEVIGELINDFNRCGKNGFIAYRDIILKPNHIKFIELFDIEN